MHGPHAGAPQSLSFAQNGMALHIWPPPPGGRPKYWMPTEMPESPGCCTNALSAVVTACHLVPPSETMSLIEPDWSCMMYMSSGRVIAWCVSAWQAAVPPVCRSPPPIRW